MGDPTITFTSQPLGYTYQQGSPSQVKGISHNIIGPLGSSTYYYWIIANYPSGTVQPTFPITVRNAPNVLSPTNSIVINWVVPNGQVTGYSVLRTTTPVFPGTSNTAVVVNTTANTVTDTGSALLAFTFIPTPLNRGVIYIDGTGPTPVLVSTLGLKTSSISFPDGTTQTTAASTAQIYSWQQDVQANQHQLLGLSTLQLVGGTFPYNFITIPTAVGSFPAGSLQINNITTGLNALNINQNGDVWIGGPPVGVRPARLSIVTPASYPTPSNASIYCYNTIGANGASIVVEASTQKSVVNVKNSAADYSLTSTGTGVNGFFVLNDNSTSPGNRIIVQAGKIGIANGTFFTPAHQLELNVDDAAKPTTSTWSITSDVRTKRNTRKLEGGLSVIERLEPVESEYNGLANTPHGHRVVSFDPDELVKILPKAVSKVRRKLNVDDDEETDIANINVHEVIFHLVLAVKQLASAHKSKKG